MQKALRSLPLGIIAALAIVSSAKADLNIFFDTYSTVPSPQIRWASTGEIVSVAEGFHANLLWEFDGHTGDAGLAIPTVTFDPGSAGGWIVGPVVTVPDFTDGPVSFTIQAWQGPSYAFAQAPGSGLGYGKITWIETDQLANQPPDFFHSIPSDFFVAIPEPSTIGLLGSGWMTLILRTRKAGR